MQARLSCACSAHTGPYHRGMGDGPPFLGRGMRGHKPDGPSQPVTFLRWHYRGGLPARAACPAFCHGRRTPGHVRGPGPGGPCWHPRPPLFLFARPVCPRAWARRRVRALPLGSPPRPGPGKVASPGLARPPAAAAQPRASGAISGRTTVPGAGWPLGGTGSVGSPVITRLLSSKLPLGRPGGAPAFWASASTTGLPLPLALSLGLAVPGARRCRTSRCGPGRRSLQVSCH